jgi:hypothetical protein
MIYEVYCEWIERAIKAADREVGKLESALGQSGSKSKAWRG